MGQYYTPVEIISLDDGTHFRISSFSCQVKGLGYNGVKLMEHSWWDNDFLANFCARLYEKVEKTIMKHIFYGLAIMQILTVFRHWMDFQCVMLEHPILG